MIQLSNFSTQEVRKRYPGICRIVGTDYFGYDYRNVSFACGLGERECIQLYERVTQCLRYYGFDNNKNVKKKMRTVDYELDDRIIREYIEIRVPAVAIYREYCGCLDAKKEAKDKLQADRSILGVEYGGSSSKKFIYPLNVPSPTSGNGKSLFITVKRFTPSTVRGWESLSLSVELAHEAMIYQILNSTGISSDVMYCLCRKALNEVIENVTIVNDIDSVIHTNAVRALIPRNSMKNDDSIHKGNWIVSMADSPMVPDTNDNDPNRLIESMISLRNSESLLDIDKMALKRGGVL